MTLAIFQVLNNFGSYGRKVKPALFLKFWANVNLEELIIQLSREEERRSHKIEWIKEKEKEKRRIVIAWGQMKNK